MITPHITQLWYGHVMITPHITQLWYGYVMITPHIAQLWYGHVVTSEDEHINRRVLEMKMEGMRPRGRPKRRWLDYVAEDMKEKNSEGADAQDRRKWRQAVMNVDS